MMMLYAVASSSLSAEDPMSASDFVDAFTTEWNNNGSCVQECWDEFLQHEDEDKYNQCVDACGESYLVDSIPLVFGVPASTILQDPTNLDLLLGAVDDARGLDETLLNSQSSMSEGIEQMLEHLGGCSTPSTLDAEFLQTHASVRLYELTHESSIDEEDLLQTGTVDLLEVGLQVTSEDVGLVLRSSIETLFDTPEITEDLQVRYEVESGEELLDALEAEAEPGTLDWLFGALPSE
jgi:hypothetical protein